MFLDLIYINSLYSLSYLDLCMVVYVVKNNRI